MTSESGGVGLPHGGKEERGDGGVECCGASFADDEIAEVEGGGDARDAAEEAKNAKQGAEAEDVIGTSIKSCAFK